MPVGAVFTESVRDSISMTEAAQLLNCHVSTIWRYWNPGVRGVRLETFLAGAGKRRTTRAAVEQFLSALNSSQRAPIMTLHPVNNSTATVKTLLNNPQ